MKFILSDQSAPSLNLFLRHNRIRETYRGALFILAFADVVSARDYRVIRIRAFILARAVLVITL